MPLIYDKERFVRNVQDNTMREDSDMLSEPMYVNAYCTSLAWGGPEEGGWWYPYGEPLESIKVRTKEQAVLAFSLLDSFYKDQYEDGPPVSSVAHDGDLNIVLENEPADFYPKVRPHYE